MDLRILWDEGGYVTGLRAVAGSPPAGLRARALAAGSVKSGGATIMGVMPALAELPDARWRDVPGFPTLNWWRSCARATCLINRLLAAL